MGFARTLCRSLPLLLTAALVSPALVAQESEGKKYALLVGVKKYGEGTGLRDLEYAEKDVTDLAAVLEGQGYKVTVLTRAESIRRDKEFLSPTAENIRDQLDDVTKNRKPEDTLLVAFSGHGAHLKETDRLYFCPAGTRLGKPGTLVCIDDVMAALKGCKAGAKVLLFDACRNDPADGRAGGAPSELKSSTRPLVPDLPGGTVALFSCSKGEISHESKALGRGFLFHHVIEGLEGKAADKKGEVTWQRLALYVSEELPESVKREKGPKAVQTPEVRGEARAIVLGRGGDFKELTEADFRAFEVGGLRLLEEAPKKLAVWRRAAEEGIHAGQYLFARCLADGIGTPKDEKSAAAWYRKSAEGGNSWAMNGLGLMYAEGRGVGQDDKEAFEWYGKAAKVGHPKGMHNLGTTYYAGVGVGKDYGEAFKWFKKAAEAGEPMSMYAVGTMYEFGLSVGQDNKEAVRWYQKGAKLGEANSKKALERLGEK